MALLAHRDVTIVACVVKVIPEIAFFALLASKARLRVAVFNLDVATLVKRVSVIFSVKDDLIAHPR